VPELPQRPVRRPSLLLIAFGVYLLDKGRPWWSTAAFALSGLGKETNLLGSAALLPKLADGGRAWAWPSSADY